MDQFLVSRLGQGRWACVAWPRSTRLRLLLTRCLPRRPQYRKNLRHSHHRTSSRWTGAPWLRSCKRTLVQGRVPRFRRCAVSAAARGINVRDWSVKAPVTVLGHLGCSVCWLGASGCFILFAALVLRTLLSAAASGRAQAAHSRGVPFCRSFMIDSWVWLDWPSLFLTSQVCEVEFFPCGDNVFFSKLGTVFGARKRTQKVGRLGIQQ
jgi:hypothetical protein